MIADYFIRGFKMPFLGYWILAFIGILWASFQVYSETYKLIPNPLPLNPALEIELLEGNEYSYELLDKTTWFDKRDADYFVPDAIISIHLKILNSGTDALEILSIYGSCSEGANFPWMGEVYESSLEHGVKINYPYSLSLAGILTLHLVSKLIPHIGGSDAVFAAYLAELGNQYPAIMKVKITVKAQDSTGKLHSFSKSFDISKRPLKDLYIEQWQSNKRERLLKVANAGQDQSRSIERTMERQNLKRSS